ncbi:MAG: hypothetical protein HC836_34715 [Richelia sp. RM2_1_2]|nr:hypothetical protein [Richelia sp. RM2_1_2]
MVTQGYMTYGSVQFQRAVYFWYIPIMGAIGLAMLYMTKLVTEFFIWFYHWLFFTKHKPAPVPVPVVKKPRKKRTPKLKPVEVEKLTDDEIMKRASVIALANAKAKINENKEKWSKKKKQKKIINWNS